MKTIRPHSLALLVLCLATFQEVPPAAAERPLDHYAQWQKAAPEYLDIEIIDLNIRVEQKNDRLKVHHVQALAIVHRVYRTTTELAEGEEISIHYEHMEDLVTRAGPAAIPLLKKGEKYPAFLEINPTRDSYDPAASNQSFRPYLCDRSPSLCSTEN